jgi:hypothetical protein
VFAAVMMSAPACMTADALDMYAHALEESGRHAQAIAVEVMRLVIDTVCTDALIGRSACFLKTGDFKSALTDADAAISIEPDCAVANGNRAQAL